MRILDAVEGERAWEAADRAAGTTEKVDGQYDPEHYRRIARADRDVWAWISEKAYWEALEVLPPVNVPGGFQVSEAVCTTDDGTEEVYLTIIGHVRKSIASYQTRKDALKSKAWMKVL